MKPRDAHTCLSLDRVSSCRILVLCRVPAKSKSRRFSLRRRTNISDASFQTVPLYMVESLTDGISNTSDFSPIEEPYDIRDSNRRSNSLDLKDLIGRLVG